MNDTMISWKKIKQGDHPLQGGLLVDFHWAKYKNPSRNGWWFSYTQKKRGGSLWQQSLTVDMRHSDALSAAKLAYTLRTKQTDVPVWNVVDTQCR